MSKIRIKRHNSYKKWTLPKTPNYSVFPAESALFERLRDSSTQFFHPFQFPFTDDKSYNYHLAFLVEAVELMPEKLDLSFDAVWKAFESFYARHVIAPRDFKLHQEAPEIAKQIDSETKLQPVLAQLLEFIPIQSCKYIVQRIMLHWEVEKVGSNKTDYKLIWSRLTNPIGNHDDVTNLLHLIAKKYGAPSLTPDSSRKAAMLLRLALGGLEVEVQGTRTSIPQKQRVSFLINALLYTFRNDRFHGNMQPPFKSSLGTLQTYAHTHYCFLWAHLLFLFAVSKRLPNSVSIQDLANNTIANIETFSEFYGKHLLK